MPTIKAILVEPPTFNCTAVATTSAQAFPSELQALVTSWTVTQVLNQALFELETIPLCFTSHAQYQRLMRRCVAEETRAQIAAQVREQCISEPNWYPAVVASVQNCEFKLYHPDHPDHLWPDEFQTGSAVVWSLGTSEQHADWNIGVLRIPRSRDKIFMRTKLRSGNMPSADCHVRVLVVANLIPAIRIWDGLENDAPMKQDVRHPGQSRDVKFDSSVSLTHDTTILVPESHVEGKRLSLGYRERHYKVQVPEGSQHEHVNLLGVKCGYLTFCPKNK